MTFDYGALLIAVLSFAASGLIAWGVYKARDTEHARRILECETCIEKIYERLNNLHETFVSYRHFNETMTAMREQAQELRADIKEVLSIVSRLKS